MFDFGNLAQWASACIAAGSLVVAILSYCKAMKTSTKLAAVSLKVEEIQIQIASVVVRTGGSGGSGGVMGGGGGGGGGTGQAGGDGGSVYFDLKQNDP